MWARHVLESTLAAAPIGALRARDIWAFISGLLSRRKDSGKGFRTQTIANVTNLLRKCLSDAVADELILSNVASGVSIPRRRGESATETAYLTAAEVDAVSSCEAIPERKQLIFTVAIFTGLRAGELWALRWAAVELDGERPQITVRRSHRNAPKNGKVQTVPLLEPARIALVRTRELLTEREGDDLVFPSKRGFQRQPNDDAGWCTRKRKKGVLEPGLQELAGITRRVRFHDLRHTCASHLVMGTWGSPWPLADVAKMLRHSSITVTERYAHLAPGYLHEQSRRTARTTAAGPKLALSDPSPSASPDAVTQDLGHDLSHPSGLNRRPAVYETAALPLS
jgi:integrase